MSSRHLADVETFLSSANCVYILNHFVRRLRTGAANSEEYLLLVYCDQDNKDES